MAKKTPTPAAKKTTRKAPPARAPRPVNGRITAVADNAEAATADSLDRVRDILFGTQQRDNESRFARMEEHTAGELQVLREEFRKRLDSLDQYARTEIASVVERLKAEGTRQTQAVKDLAALHKEELKALDKQHTDVMKDLDKRLKAADDAAQKRDGDLRKELLDQSAALRDEVQTARSELTENLSRTAADLRDGKLDRSMLAELLTQVAIQIAGEAPAPRRK